jgi:hypothetical protein
MYQIGDYIQFTNEGFFPKHGEIFKIETEDDRTKYGVLCKEFGGDQWHAYENEDIKKITKEEFEEDFKPYENFAGDRKRLLESTDGHRMPLKDLSKKLRKSLKKLRKSLKKKRTKHSPNRKRSQKKK